MAREEKVVFVLRVLGQSFQFIPTDSIEGLSKELKQKPLESFLWSTKS